MSCCQPNPKALKLLVEHSEDYEQFESEEVLTWCTGCGNFGIQNALKRALTLEGIGIQDMLMCFDIGCSGNGSDKIQGYTFHGLHGRVLPIASGAVIANPKLKVIASAGDGATFSEGVNHLIHAVRNDYPMLFIIHNNMNYGLTTGQASATTPNGVPMNASPDGVTADPLNPCELILSLNPSFLARTFTGDVEHMTEMFQAGLQHKGFACIEVMQICTTYNHATPQEWYWERVQYIRDNKKYDRTDIWAAKKAAADMENNINLGILFEDQKKVNFLNRLENRKQI
ncbi:MAG: thiamine pyrophosphate-dependent enzyme, partial [Candidatus Gracilibacteria bacterium]|nr:thiamine pyrophosphate-dependent enzyme [Candidatus Gracilibacteria bacterium]